MNAFPDLSGTTLLVSGVNGFLGAHTAVAAARGGANVVGIDLPGSSPRGEKTRQALGGGDISVREADLSNAGAWFDTLRDVQPDIVLHIAGTTRRGATLEDWTATITGNLLTTTSMIEAVLGLPTQGRPIVVYPGSQMEYGAAPMPWTEDTLCKPANFYGASKLASTDLVLAVARTEQFRACVARFAILYGPAQTPTMLIPAVIAKGLSGTNFAMTEGRQKRRFLYVEDAASLLLELGARLLKGEKVPSLLNMPACDLISIREVAQQVVDCMGRPISLEIGAAADRAGEAMEFRLDDSQAGSLGFSCHTSLAEGLARTVEWYKNNSWFLV